MSNVKLKDFITAENELDGQEYAYISQQDKTRKTTIQKIKDFVLGTATLVTNDKTVKGAINEVNASLSEKANKNYIINGNFDVWQRGTSLINPANATYLADRFYIRNSITTGAPTTLTHSKQQIQNGEVSNAANYYRITSDSVSNIGTNETYRLVQYIENGTRKLCGTNRKVTISFYARSNIPNKKIGVAFTQGYGTGGSASPNDGLVGKTVTLSNTFKKYSVTFDCASLADKIFGTNNDDIAILTLGLAYGVSNGSNFGDTVAENFGVGYVDIAQVKLESGDKATPFVPRLYGEELNNCLRYYYDSVTKLNTGTAFMPTAILMNTKFPVPMRTVPTVSIYGTTLNTIRRSDTGAIINLTSPVLGYVSNFGFATLSDSSAPFVIGVPYDFRTVYDAEIY